VKGMPFEGGKRYITAGVSKNYKISGFHGLQI
jgi:hypothetical protein